jgi:hypothetical protein
MTHSRCIPCLRPCEKELAIIRKPLTKEKADARPGSNALASKPKKT